MLAFGWLLVDNFERLEIILWLLKRVIIFMAGPFKKNVPAAWTAGFFFVLRKYFPLKY